MNSGGKYGLWMAVILSGLVVSLVAGEFVPPAEGPVAFRRDRIPLDPDTIEGLSKQLEILARGLDAETAEQRRGMAQMLGLALALDPGNVKARDVLARLVKDRHEVDVEEEDVVKARARVWQYMAWLGTPEAGDQAQALAACLGDVLVISDPGDPRMKSLSAQGEKGKWAGWIPPVAAYETKERAEIEEPADVEAVVKLAKAQVYTPLWQNVGKDPVVDWQLLPSPLVMSAAFDEAEEREKQPVEIRIGSGEESRLFQNMGKSIGQLVRTIYPEAPPGLVISIGGEALSESIRSKKRMSISASVAVLASAAITGREPNAIILGQIDENGAFTLPTAFWDQLRSLGEGQGQRLVVPSAAASDLSSMLALEKPGFFMQYEVVLASSFKELIELSAKTPEGALAGPLAEFSQIRERCGNQDIREYIGNSFVKRRLAEVLQKAPYHYSSRMLLTQAAGNRPTWVSRSVLAAEIRRAMAPMGWTINDQLSDPDPADYARLGETYDICRSQVDGLERYAEKKDRELLEGASGVVLELRNLERASRSRGEEYVVLAEMRKARGGLVTAYKELMAQLKMETDDPPDGGKK